MYNSKVVNKTQFLRVAKIWLLYGMIITIIFSRLNLNSLCMILFTLVWVAEGGFKNKWALLKKDTFFLAYLLYFLIQFAGMAQSETLYSGWLGVEDKLGFLMLPMVFCSTPFVNIAMRRKFMIALSLTITIAAIYCLVVSGMQYFKTGDAVFLFYHELVSPISQHAIYFSAFTFIAFVFLITEYNCLPWLSNHKPVYISWIIFLVTFLFLLSSKMVLLVLLLFLLYLFLRVGTKKIRRWQALGGGLFAILLIIAIISTSNPVHKRFSDLQGNIELLKKDSYNAGTYFNGWQFRVLLWRVTYDIIRDRDAWIIGVGSPNAQKILNEKYLVLGLYSGDKNSGDRGYLKYNCHNQFLQTFMQSGLIGLLILLGWCYLLFKKMRSKKEPVLAWSLIVLVCFFFIESVFERQYGIMLCTIIPLIYIYSAKDVITS